MKTILSASIAAVSFCVWLGCSHSPTPTNEYGHTNLSRKVSSDDDLTTTWAYDPGPDANTAMGKELIDLVATQPNTPGISMEISGDQKFRPAFGPTLWRMIQKPNSLKILFIGQDGTHIAEAAGRTATAGFGGRAQDLAAYFGVNTGAAFINTFAFTIRQQYGAFQTPIITQENGVKKVSFGNVVDNGMWMIAQDQNSPMVIWRNKLIDWIMRNNRDSLRMVVLFGGAAKDSMGTFVESHGGHVGTRFSTDDIINKNLRVPEVNQVFAGSNKVFPVVLDRNGKDIYTNLAHRTLDYSKDADQKAATDALFKNISQVYGNLMITNAGIGQSGVIHPAQINGYDLDKIQINGKTTLSLQGLKLSDGTQVTSNVLVADFPHPTALSMLTPDQASAKIQQSLTELAPYVQAGWVIEPDPGMTNKFQAGQVYQYARTDIPHAYYDFGTPNNRMVSKSDASRMTGKANVIILGTRDRAQFDLQKLTSATATQPNQLPSGDEMFNARPRTTPDRYAFDHGPGEEMARIMKQNLDMSQIGALKPDYKLKPNVKLQPNQQVADLADADGFNIKTHPVAVGDFGHYRGTFKNPRVVILADPDGLDEILTSRAMTGTRGQYLQGLMNKMGVAENHLVIRTVPFGMDGATDQEWSTVLSQTAKYRSEIFAAILKNGTPDLILTDGPYAAKEIARIAGSSSTIPVVNINRQGTENASGLIEAADQINKLGKFNSISGDPAMANIPRSHLGFMSRVWEGTSGTRVFNSTSPELNGVAFAVVAPSWAYTQKDVKQSPEERSEIEMLKGTLQQNHIPPLKPLVPAPPAAGGDAFLFFPGRFDENSIPA